MKCYICPRECGADRENGQLGVCGATDKISVARVGLHMWEEPCISGNEGSGTVFFTGCPLGCVYCQNYKISRKDSNTRMNLEHTRHGNHECAISEQAVTEKQECVISEQAESENYKRVLSTEELADAFLHLQDEKANNINLVTPTHYSYQIIEAIEIAREKGLKISIVYNCSGYEKVETLKSLNGYVDVYLTDFKYMDRELAKNYSRAVDYVEVAKLALSEMVNQCPKPVFDEKGIMRKGVIVRNLLLPGHVKNSKAVVKYIAEKYGNSVYLSLMSQYTPLEQVNGIPPLNRKITKREYNRLIDYALLLNLENVFIQEGDVAKESFIPEF